MPHKQTRKIIRVGNSLAVTIPKPWITYYDLSVKDSVTVLSNGAIVIKPVLQEEKSIEPKSVAANLSRNQTNI